MEIRDQLKKEIEESKNIDPERVILRLSNFMSYYPYFRDKFDAYYEIDKIKFYETAVKNKLYNEDIFSDKRLSQEISMRRIFAILLAAEENEIVKDFVLKTIEGFEPTKVLIKAIKSKNATKVDDCYKHFNESDNTLKCYCIILVLYCIHAYFGFNSDNFNVGIMRYTHYKDEKNHLYATGQNLINNIEKIDYFEHVVFRRDHRKIFRELKTYGDILSIIDLNIGKNTMDAQLLSNHLRPLFNAADGYDTMLNLYRFFSIISYTFGYFGLSPTCFYQEATLSEDDKKIILKIASKAYSEKASQNPPELPFYYYIVTAMFFQTAKGMREDRDCFFQNNSETQFYTLKKSEKQIEDLAAENFLLQEKLNEAITEKEKYKSLYSKLQSDFFENQLKNEKELYSTFKDEIDTLKEKVSSLERLISDKDKDSEELHRLRELAFSLESGDIPARQRKTIDELIGNNKVIIVGGHINLRNKLAEKYKSIFILDGHNVSFDENLIKSADLVLFNTANMSHSLYYKIMPVLKTNNIKFDYISRSLNLDILEAEISNLLEKYLK